MALESSCLSTLQYCHSSRTDNCPSSGAGQLLLNISVIFRPVDPFLPLGVISFDQIRNMTTTSAVRRYVRTVCTCASQDVALRAGNGASVGVVERRHACIAGFGKLCMRSERQLDTYLALLKIACSINCFRSGERFC